VKYTVFGKLWQAFLDLVDLEQLVISNASHFTYPLWPPPFAVDLVHWWGRSFDPLVIARPVWWKVTIWIDALFFGPFYLMAIYAFLRGKEWIRIPSIIYASVMLTNVTIILSEEAFGPYRTPAFGIVFLTNLPWLLFPWPFCTVWGRIRHLSRTTSSQMPRPATPKWRSEAYDQQQHQGHIHLIRQ
jgi:hypothetical protein